MMILAYCLFILFAGSYGGAIPENDNLLRIPLVHMESGLEKLFRLGADIKLVEGLYNMNKANAQPIGVVLQKGKPVPSNDTLNLFKYFQTQYYGIINIGKPGRPFKMVMDSGWGYSWVPSKDCPSSSLPCDRHNKYNHDQSSTYKKDGREFNVSNSFIGYLSNDLFHVGHLNATNQVFAELTKLPFIFTLYETDGTLGLGPKALSSQALPFFYNFAEENNLKKIFSFYVNRDPTTERGGSLFFGGINYAHNKTAFRSVDVTSDYYWEFKMKKVSVVISKKKRIDFCVNGCTAIADTSTNTIVGPEDEVKEINRLLGAERIFFSDRYLIPCVNEYKGPKVSFSFAGREFLISGQEYIQKLSYSGFTVCLSAFQPDDSKTLPPNTWSLGGAFLYRYYTAFDVENQKIMFADVS